MRGNYGSGWKRMTRWQRWISRPQTLWLRKAIFQIHLWCGIGVGLYILVVSTTGSIVVYSNELYMAATPKPVTVVQTGPRLTYEELKAAAVRSFPGYSVTSIGGGERSDQTVTVFLDGKAGSKSRLFNPYTGEDLGDSVPLSILAVAKLLSCMTTCLAGAPAGESTALAP